MGANPVTRDASALPLTSARIAERLELDSDTAAVLTWLVLCEVVDHAEERSPRNWLRAARHLLGRVEYGQFEDDPIPDVGVSWLELRKGKVPRQWTGIPNASQRRFIADAVSNRAVPDRYNLMPKLSNLKTNSADLNALAGAVLDAMLALIDDRIALTPLLGRARATVTQSSELVAIADEPPRPLNTPVPASPKASRRGRKSRTAAAVVATAAVVVLGVMLWMPSGDSNQRPKHPVTPLLVVRPPDGGPWAAGWGPERTVYTGKQGGSPYPTFNSITDNPSVGDERYFVSLRNTQFTGQGDWNNDVYGRPGDTFRVRIYVDNTGQDDNGVVSAGWIQGAKLYLQLHEGTDAVSISGTLSAANTQSVWDGATVHLPKGAHLGLVPDSGVLYSNAHPTPGLALPVEPMFTRDGLQLGYKKMDGTINPGFQYAAYVLVTLKVHT